MKRQFKHVYLFGYSPMFVDIYKICKKYDIDIYLICGKRQIDLIQKLSIQIEKENLYILDSLRKEKLGHIIKSPQSSIGISFGSPFIFTQYDIDQFSGNLINSHGAPLPEFKGGGGFSWRILQGDKRGASLMHLVSTKVDEGKIVFRNDFKFSKNEILPIDYERKQLSKDRENILPWLDSILNGNSKIKEITPEKGNEVYRESYFPRLQTDIHGFIDWKIDIDSIQSFIQAFSRPYSGASTFIKGEKIRILNCTISAKTFVHPFLYGLITNIEEESFQICSKGGFLRVKFNDLMYENKIIKLYLGDRLYTPESYLEKAISSRVIFKPDGPRLIEYEE